MRYEEDSLGKIEVSDENLWGAQTQRTLENFHIGTQKMPPEIIWGLLAIKRAAAEANYELGILDKEKATLIDKAIASIGESELTSEFPLSIWQTGSGTATNMNVNEVIANRANELAGKGRGVKSPIHPNDHVNKSQSSNDTFPTAMHVSFVYIIKNKLLPALSQLEKALLAKAKEFHHIIKVGRTHLMDAVPLRLGDEFSGYAAQIHDGIEAITATLPHLCRLAIGGTAVGTGINCAKGFKEKVCKKLSERFSIEFLPAKNSFEALACHDSAVALSGALKRIACSLFKIANDIRLMASGPRCGLGEIILPENEPGSSIMPGKINPTQCEATTMIACQVIGNDTAISLAGTQGHFELNVFKPLIAKNCLESLLLLTDISISFSEKCITRIKANETAIHNLLEKSLLLATALNKDIGYDATAKIVLKATRENITLRQAALQLGISEELFDKATNPENMV